MDPQLAKLIHEFDQFQREWKDLGRKVDDMKRDIEEIYREMGVKQGREMFDQVNRMEERDLRNEDKFNQMLVEINHINKLLEYNDVNTKEIMKALTLIYRNTDELEDTVVPVRQTR